MFSLTLKNNSTGGTQNFTDIPEVIVHTRHRAKRLDDTRKILQAVLADNAASIEFKANGKKFNKSLTEFTLTNLDRN
ncbi:hypothetical protein EQG49_10410 [Periweissella cryptocerci]|uniref:Uncharacterized protein n=1 Tax=Periweissella cryptocerci TaxID=2506420 RepID=A0A4V1AIV5_9LACO|nr:hypothetical protein [Periweissella cryptocerci]QBO36825.1 hypothetical protein EQG49_10410 [Periweissella cryptocerci]